MWRRGGVQELIPGEPSNQLMCFGYIPSPGHFERLTSEIGFKPAKWNPSDIQWWEGGQEDLMIDSVKSGRQIQQNEDWWFGIGFCNSQGFSDWEKRSLSWMATPETWLFSVQFVVLWKKQWDLVEDNSFECFRYEWKERDTFIVFYKRSVSCRFFEQWGYPSLLECSGEDACEERCVDNGCECW